MNGVISGVHLAVVIEELCAVVKKHDLSPHIAIQALAGAQQSIQGTNSEQLAIQQSGQRVEEFVDSLMIYIEKRLQEQDQVQLSAEEIAALAQLTSCILVRA